MKHAIIVAHPDSGSLNVALAGTYAAAARKLGHQADVRDLYALNFDPCLKTEEIPGPGAPRFGADVLAERALLADADVIAFVYPLWFNAPPAILKGYVDRVFGMGFGFRPGAGETEPGLVGKRLISITTSGAPDRWIRETGAIETLTRQFDAYLGSVTGLRIVDHVHIGGMVSGVTSEAYAAALESVRAAVLRHFG